MCIRTSYKFSITEEAIEQYAALSGDDNPVHLDSKEARKQGFQAPIAHGLLTMGLTMNVISPFLDKGMTIREYEVQFLQPVYRNETVEVMVERDFGDNDILLKITGKKIKGSVTLQH
ncbi:MaoC like domain-containing protein [Salimicrobium flavidum]|uniref:MaoC like domain-containing protein n=1 Tax=Salimicrobium flavidum TaxID=570947 RepID=A0A1N7J345_9BACI|nr:MaoC like domain-containing protein [Salimicrobium flavidum]